MAARWDIARTAVLHRIGEPPPGSSLTIRALATIGRRILLSRYLAADRAQQAMDDGLLERWEVVRAAARLWDPVPDEHPALLRFLRSRLGEPAT